MAEPQFWEPWQPKVGDRVSIRRSAECPHRQECLHAEDAEDGAVGVVFQVFAATYGCAVHDGHGTFVTFNADDEGRYVAGWFAPIELEPA